MNTLLEKIGVGLSQNANALLASARSVCTNEKNQADAKMAGMEKRAVLFAAFAQCASELDKSKIRVAEMERVIRQKCSKAGLEEHIAEAAGCLGWGRVEVAESEILKVIAWDYVRENLDSILDLMRARATASLEASVADFRKQNAAIIREFSP
jgi:hypothetical protein